MKRSFDLNRIEEQIKESHNNKLTNYGPFYTNEGRRRRKVGHVRYANEKVTPTGHGNAKRAREGDEESKNEPLEV